jgi:hypothetical protein
MKRKPDIAIRQFSQSIRIPSNMGSLATILTGELGA